MKLPNAEHAIVDSDKLTDYLLSKRHLIGRWKARFFFSVGFRKEKAYELKEALLHVARNGEVQSTISTEFGVKYIVEGMITGPSGRKAAIHTVWIVDTGQHRPRLVTAYPL